MRPAEKVSALTPQQRAIYEAVPADRYVSQGEIERTLRAAGEHMVNIGVGLHALRKRGLLDAHESKKHTEWLYKRIPLGEPRARPALVSVEAAPPAEEPPKPSGAELLGEVADKLLEAADVVASMAKALADTDDLRSQVAKLTAELDELRALREQKAQISEARAAIRALLEGDA